MRRFLSAGLLVAMVWLPVTAAPKAMPLKVEGEVITLVKALPFKVVAPAGATLYDWTFPDSVKGTAEDHVLTVTSAPKGTFKVRCRMLTIDFEKKSVVKDFAEVEVNVGEVTPPTPPDPIPPKPEPLTGLRALIMFESLDNATKEQTHILNSLAVREYLDKKCKDGKKGWRKWDQHTQKIDNTVPVLQQLWKDSKDKVGKLPVLILASDQKAEIHPLPATEKETLDLLKKWGGE